MIEYAKFKLSNGLQVVNHYDPSSAVVAVDVLYNVGARDEDPGSTGLAHLLEHLMFGGSVNVSDFDREMELAGGWNNAWTTNDFTNFYEVVPAGNVETAFWLESDRMLGLAFSPRSLDVQRRVVVEEFKQTCLNRPYGDMNHLMRSLLYKVHPYRWPTIGLVPEHIERVALGQVEEFFNARYSPDNAVLSVAGNITPGRTRELAEKWFGDIPRRNPAKRSLPAEPPFDGPRRLTARGNVSATALTIAFPMCGRGAEGYEAADIVTDILSTGTSSRFRHELLKRHSIFTEADAAIAGSEEPGYLTIGCRLNDGRQSTAAEAERLVWESLDRLTGGGVTETELTRAVNKFESHHTYGLIGVLPKAQALAHAVMCGYDINGIVPRYRALTVDDINSAARTIIAPARSATLLYLPR